METTDLVRFRQFEINIQTGELRKEGVPVAAATVYAVEAGPRNEDHHRIAVHVVQAVHNFLF